MAGAPYKGPERRRTQRSAAAERAEITLRLMLTTERLERLAKRLEAFVTTPPSPRESSHDRAD